MGALKYYSEDFEIKTSNFETEQQIEIRYSGVGAVYYTNDGTDPRMWDLKGSINEKAIKLTSDSVITYSSDSTIFKARTKLGDEWSPLHELTVFTDKVIIPVVLNNNVAWELEGVLYPNPVSNELYIKHHRDFMDNEIIIINSIGDEVYRQALMPEVHMVDVSVLSSGIYFVSIQKDGRSSMIKKIVKN